MADTEPFESNPLQTDPENANADTPRLSKPKKTFQRIDALESRVETVDDKLNRVFELLQGPKAPLSDPSSTATGEAAPRASVFGPAVPVQPHEPPLGHSTAGTGLLTQRLPAPTFDSVLAALDGKEALSSSGLAHWAKPFHLGVFPARFFQPKKEGLYRRICDSDARDGHKAKSLWNIGYNLEVSLTATHEVVLAANANDMKSLKEKLAVQVHFLQLALEVFKERRDFFYEAQENGKSEAILYSSLLRDEAAPHASNRFRQYNAEFCQACASALAKELAKSLVQPKSRRNPQPASAAPNRGRRNNNNNKRNRGRAPQAPPAHNESGRGDGGHQD